MPNFQYDKLSTREHSINDDVEDSQGLLNHNESSERALESTLSRNRRYLFLHALLIAAYSLLFLIIITKTQQRLGFPAIHSPALEAVKYERVRFNATLIIDSEYNGPPGPEVDRAWTNLLENMNIAVSKSDLEHIGASSIAVPGSTDTYVAGLSVYHELHCLKRLRQYTWREYYHKGSTPDEERLLRLHTDHCIDVLRQAILCHSDTSLFTLEWSTGQAMPRADFSHEHSCKDWRSLFEWAGQRRVPDSTMSGLRHPVLGPAFPSGEGDKLGASEDHSPKVQG